MTLGRGQKVPLGKILIDQGKLTPDQLQQALAAQKSTTDKLGRLLVDLGFVKERDVLKAYASQFNIPMYDPTTVTADPAVEKLIPENLIKRYNVAPIRRNGAKLVVALQDPTNLPAIDDLRMATRMEIEPVLATAEDIAALRNGGTALEPVVQIPPTASTVELPSDTPAPSNNTDFTSMLESIRRPDSPSESGRAETDEALEIAEEAPIIRMVNVLIQNAIKEDASDIHVEPERKNVRIRYRIDGVLYETMTLPKFAHAPLLSRLKIMSDMNIAERRVPQDGRIHIRHNKRDYDMRVNVLPTVFGEKCVMRILDQTSVLIGLGRLGFMPEMMAEIEELIVRPNGMILATGPTGSGKTTSLYSILNKINSVEMNIITVEDPVEYQLPGVNQVSVNRKAGLTFPIAMRAFLRQDPDIIMVGEIRDLETAEIAVQASLTGHLVLSTLHTNDAPATIVRLSDMGVEPFLIAASVIGVIAQRLARRLCDNCKAPMDPPRDALFRLGLREADLEGATFCKATGCERCSGRGFKGRLGVYEFMALNEEICEQIVRRAPLSEITQTAVANGMTSLLKDGMAKVRLGLTTVEEVLRVVSAH